MLSPIQNKVESKLEKHQQLFKSFLDLFKRVFGKPVNEESLRSIRGDFEESLRSP